MNNRASTNTSGKKLRQHRYAFKSAIKSLSFYRWAVATNTLILGLLLALPLGLYCGFKYLNHVALDIAHSRTALIRFAAASSATDQDNILSRTSSNPLFAEPRLVNRQDLMRDLLRELEVEESPLLFEINPLPDMLASKLSARDVDQRAIDALLAELRSEQAITSIEIIDAEPNSLADLDPNLFRQVGSILGGTILLSVILLCGNMVRSQLSRQQLEIEVTRYCGAEPAFIRRPFLYWGIIQALLGTGLAIAVVIFCWGLVAEPMAAVTAGARRSISPLSITESGGALLLGAILGWLAAWFATRIHLSADI